MVGFAMVHPYSVLGHTPDHTMAEFTVFPTYRRKHYACEAARLLLAAFPGRREIKYNEKNRPAKQLWNAIAAPYHPLLFHLNEQESVLEFDTSKKIF